MVAHPLVVKGKLYHWMESYPRFTLALQESMSIAVEELKYCVFASWHTCLCATTPVLLRNKLEGSVVSE